MEPWELLLQRHAPELDAVLRDGNFFYGAAAVLFVFGAFLVGKTDIIGVFGGDEFARRRTLRLVGMLAIAIALLSLGLLTYVKTEYVHTVDPDAVAAIQSSEVSLTYPQASTALHHSFIEETAKESDSDPVSSPAPLAPSFQLASTSVSAADAATEHPTLLPSLATVGQADKITAEMKEATHYFEEKRYSEALEDANAVLDMAPQNAQAYFLRGNIYAKKRNWAEAEADFKSALRIKGSSVGVTFNLAELQFMQKNYDVARPGFLSLKDSDMGDLAMFKVFLCDLFGGHDKVAARELAAFNQVGSNASYYFANIAWSLFYHQADDARDWLASAQKIYSPSKVATYSTSLVELGYLPLPQAPDVATIH